MELYNKKEDRIESVRVITNNGIQYPSRMTEAQLNKIEYYKLKLTNQPNSRYYIYEKSGELIDNIYQVNYIKQAKDIDLVKQSMIEDLKLTFKEKALRPIIDTGLGYSVDGGREDLENFKVGKEFGFEYVKDSEGEMKPATAENYDTIILEIKKYGILLYQKKWEKEEEIENLQTVDDCILYEKTPYQKEIEIFDKETLEPTGETEIATLYKNNVKEW